MSEFVYVFSTLSNDQQYTSYVTDKDNAQVEHAILIEGGANVMTKRFVTPRGVATRITAEQLVILENNEVFQLHKANGYIEVSNSKEDADEMAASMTGRDESAPLVDEDFAAQGQQAPVSNKAPDAEETPAPAATGRRRGK